jgi:hypothetical protein
MRFTLNQVVEIVVEALKLDPKRAGAVRARLQHFQRLDFPEGIKGTVRGRRANYDEERVVKVALAFELLDVGFTPARMRATIVQHWQEIRSAFALAAAHRETAIYIATYPNALDGLRASIDKAEISWVHSGFTLEELGGMFSQRSVLTAPSLAAINLTGLLLDVATAVGNLAAPRAAALVKGEEFIAVLDSWNQEINE